MPIRKMLVLALLPLAALAAPEVEEQAALQKPYTVEYYYRVKWGYTEEFMELYRSNHWPVIAADMARGEILDFRLERLLMQGAESHRWDVRATITFRNILIPHGLVDRAREPILKKLFPDRERFAREEKRRFELLEALMEYEVEPVAFNDWPTTGQHPACEADCE